MWLINTTTLKLESFMGPGDARYAILSHTWGDNEVSFQEFQNLAEAEKKPSFDKIRQTCHLAREISIPYAWVDTCCIDKSSSAELSEAINSMFEWYQDAEVCFVFLSDVEPWPGVNESKTYNSDIQDLENFTEQFKKCRWITRGWTLQELIAPTDVRFYDRVWVERTNKYDFQHSLSAITGIATDCFHSKNALKNTLVATRMSWVAERQTTRVEDMAYCMLGIFDVNMPMIYGEGHKAFQRLQEEIAKQTCDLSLFAWTRTPNQFMWGSVCAGVFAQSPIDFRDCGQLVNAKPGTRHSKEFTITNKGLKIDASLFGLEGQEDDLIFDLGVTVRSVGLPRSSNWLGIYLRKTPEGYVRSRPDVFYDPAFPGAPRVQGVEVSATLYILKRLGAEQLHNITNQYSDSICLKTLPKYTKILAIQPKDLWDSKRRLMLNYGEGLNMYLHLAFHPLMTATNAAWTEVIVACSTMGSPHFCSVLSKGDSQWQQVLDFIYSSKETTDYVNNSSLATFMEGTPTDSHVARVVFCEVTNPRTGSKAKTMMDIRVSLTRGKRVLNNVYYLYVNI